MSEATLMPPEPKADSKLSEDSPEKQQSGWANERESADFRYTPVSPLGPIALVLGLCSLTGLTNNPFGLVLAAGSIVLGVTAIVKIRSMQGAVRGMGLAISGTILSVACLTLGSWKLHYDYHHEVPEGYLRVNFPKEISDRQFVFYGNQRRLHPEVAPLVGEKVFLKGYMWNLKELDGIREFVFLKDNGECCFGGEPKKYDMMLVKMKDDKTTRAFRSMIAVSGTLSADVTAGEDDPVYTVDADIVEEARTSF